MKNYLLLLIAFISMNTMAGGFSSCQTLFYKPVTYNIKNTQELCNDEFATLYSYDTKTPLMSYEHHDTAVKIKRTGKFHIDNRIPKQYQSVDSDYVKSGYDRGHMSPSGDMEDQLAQDESFQFSNIAPQSSRLNEVK
jgi:endonuclease G